MKQTPIARELLLAGGGHSHVIFLRMLAMNPIPGLKVTLVSPETSTPYSGMLPGLIAGHYSRDEAYIDLVPLCQFAGADFIRAQVKGLDPIEQLVDIGDRPPLRYDLLSIDVGSTPAPGGLSGDGVIPVKPISLFLARWQRFLAELEENKFEHLAFVGAGAGGVELCLAVDHFFRRRSSHLIPSIQLVGEAPIMLKEFPAGVRRRFEREIAAKDVSFHANFHAVRHEDGRLYASDGRQLAADKVFCVTQASAQKWFRESGLSVDQEGFILIRETLQTDSFDNVFAVGDCASLSLHKRPKAGVFAVRQGKPLYLNIRNFLHSDSLLSFRPQKHHLSLISTGAKHAVASRNGLSVGGDWVWRLKNWIDRRFMQRFSDLPAMENRPVSPLLQEFDEQMICGGCGSKVSADLLSDVIGELLGDAAPTDDAAYVDVLDGKQLIQSVDHFRSIIDDPYLQARIAVCHAFSDIYACGGQADSALAALTLPFAKPDITRGLLTQIMRGVLHQLDEEGARLLGGHTSEGVELSIGFTVNGFVEKSKAWPKSAVKPADVLILTKPLGTGTLLAANMQYRARGDWVQGAIESMLLSNREAARVLSRYNIHACTDITGFGLGGHLEEMLGQSFGAQIAVSSLPVLPGALDCLGEGLQSSLHASNRRSLRHQQSPAIFYDPQTSGGLLVALPEDEAGRCVTDLYRAGYDNAAVIGAINDSSKVSLR